jgi:hypothetical protein
MINWEGLMTGLKIKDFPPPALPAAAAAEHISSLKPADKYQVVWSKLIAK